VNHISRSSIASVSPLIIANRYAYTILSLNWYPMLLKCIQLILQLNFHFHVIATVIVIVFHAIATVIVIVFHVITVSRYLTLEWQPHKKSYDDNCFSCHCYRHCMQIMSLLLSLLLLLVQIHQ